MAFFVGAIESKLKLDKSGWDTSISGVKKDQKTLGGVINANSEQIRKMGMAMTVAGGAIVAGFGMMVKKASDAQEVFSKFDVIFKDVLAKAAKDAKDLANNYGLSTLASKDMLSATGDLLTGLGMSSKVALDLSLKTQKLAVDLASFTNYSGGAKGASDALTKAMLGEREMVKSLGIVITEEMVKNKLRAESKSKLTGLALQQAKAEAVLKIAIEQSKNAMGDYGRTSESLANKQRELMARLEDLWVEIGTKLIPVVTDLTGKATITVEKIKNWIEANPELTNTLVKLTAAAGAFGLVLGPLAMMLPGLVTGFGLLGPTIGAMMGPITLVVGGLALLAAGFVTIFRTALEEEKKWLDNSVLINAALDDMSVSMEATRLAAGMSVKEWKKLRKEYDNNDMALARAIERGEEGLTLQNAQIKSTREIRKAKEAQEKIEKALTGATENLNKDIGEQIELIETEIQATKGIAVQTAWWRGELISLNDIMENVQETLEDGFVKTAIPAARDMTDVLKDTVPVFKDVGFQGKKTAKDIEESWQKALSTLAPLINMLGDEIGGAFGNAVSNISIALDQVAQSADKSLSGIMKAIGPVLAGEIGGAFGQMVSGAEKSFAGLGSAIGGAVALIPGIGTALAPVFSAVGGFIGGLFKKGKDEAQKAAEALAHHVGAITKAMSKYGDISEATAKKIQEADKTMEGFAAVSKYFGDIIRDVGVTQENVNILWERAIGIIENWHQGHLTAAEAAKAAGESFTLLLDGARKLGEEGSEAMINFILKTRELGLEVPEVTEYVISQLDRIPSALETLITAQEKTGQSIEGLELRTLKAFEAMEASGMNWTDIVHNMSPALNALRDRMEATGYTGSEAIQKLLKIAEVTEANKELFDAIEADRTIMEAFGNTGFMTGEILNGFAEDAIGNYEELKIKFGNSDDALRAMGPTLQKIRDYADAYNITLDEGTQNLIDQAIEIGAVKRAQEDSVATQERLFDKLGGRMKEIMDDVGDRIVDALSGGFDRAFGHAESAAGHTAGNISDTLGRIRPVVDIGFDYDVPSFDFEGKVDLGFDYDVPSFDFGGTVGLGFDYELPKFAGGFQHGGTIEAGPYRPTAFVFGEGPQKERATIEHTGKTFESPRRKGKSAINLTVNLYPQRLDNYAIDEASEKIFDSVERQMKRRGL